MKIRAFSNDKVQYEADLSSLCFHKNSCLGFNGFQHRFQNQKTLTKIGVQINKIYLLVLYLPSRRFPWGLVVLCVYWKASYSHLLQYFFFLFEKDNSS